MSLLDHMCPKCDYYMPLGVATSTEDAKKNPNLVDFHRYCRNCGHTQEEKKGLVMETVVQDKASQAYKVFLNEFTKSDPRLPHSKSLKCPNPRCASAKDTSLSDVIYVKYDPVNLKFLYMCNVEGCGTQWRSRS
jgi:hypothetical protein